MKKLFFIFLFFTGCFSFDKDYPPTSIWVINDSKNTIAFSASVFKFSRLAGNHVISRDFTIEPKDSVLVRQIGLKTTANPTDVFVDFIFIPNDSLLIPNPKDSLSWNSTVDSNGYKKYFLLVKNKF